MQTLKSVIAVTKMIAFLMWLNYFMLVQVSYKWNKAKNYFSWKLILKQQLGYISEMQSVLHVVDLHCTFPLPFHQRILFGTQSHFRKCPTSKEPPQSTAIIHRGNRVIIRSYIKDNFEYDIDTPNIKGLSYGHWKFDSEQIRKHIKRYT